MREQRRLRTALAWSYAMDVGDKLVSLVISFVLAGLLGPSIYGMMALALVYIFFLELLVRQGLLAALIQKKDLTDGHLNTGFIMVMTMSVVAFVVSIAFSGWWASVTSIPELATVIPVLSLYLPIKGTLLVQEAVFRRSLDFKTLAIRENLSTLGGGIVGVALAIAGAGIWALAAQQLVTVTLDVIVLWAVSPWRPRWLWSWNDAKELLSFSSRNFLAAFGLFVSDRGDSVLIGAFFGPTAVGLYRFASRLVEIVLEFTMRALQSVALPGLAPYQDRPDAFRHKTETILRFGALAVPCFGVIAGIAGPLCGIAGDEWAPAVPVLRVLCVVGGLRILYMLASPILQAKGRPGMLARLTWLAAGLSIGLLAIAGVAADDSASATEQLVVLASSRLVAAVLIVVASAALLRFVGAVGASAVIRAFAAPTMVAVVAGVVTFSLVQVPTIAELTDVAACLVAGAVGSAIAVGGLVVASPWFRRSLGETFVQWRSRSIEVAMQGSGVAGRSGASD